MRKNTYHRPTVTVISIDTDYDTLAAKSVNLGGNTDMGKGGDDEEVPGNADAKGHSFGADEGGSAASGIWDD